MLKRLRSTSREKASRSEASAGPIFATQSPGRATFFGMPAEIRNVIYEHVARDIMLSSRDLKNAKSANTSSLLLVCRQAREEYLSILLATATIKSVVTDMNFDSLLAKLSRLSESDMKALASNPNLIIRFRIKKCDSKAYVNLRKWCEYCSQPLQTSSSTTNSSTTSSSSSEKLSWLYEIDESSQVNPAQLQWYCGRILLMQQRLNNASVVAEARQVIDALDRARLGKQMLGEWGQGSASGFGHAYALFAANSAQRRE